MVRNLRNKLSFKGEIGFVVIFTCIFSMNFTSIGSDISLPDKTPSPAATLPIDSRTFLIGMNLHPKQFGNTSLTADQATANFNSAIELGKSCVEMYPRWPFLNWYETSSPTVYNQIKSYESLGWINIVYIYLADIYFDGADWHYRPLLTPDMEAGLKFNSPEFVKAVNESLKTFVQTADPKIIMLGNEVNTIFELEGLQMYTEYIDLVNQVAGGINSIYNDTLVGTVLSYTQMMVNTSDDTPWAENRLHLLNFLDDTKVYCVGINSYPFKEGFNNPSDIPDNHYKKLENYIGDLPIIFTEIGYPSGSDYISSVGEQDLFLQRFLDITANRDMNIWGVLWISLHDFAPASDDAQHRLSGGLRDVNSNPKSIWYTWMKLKGLNITGPMQSFYSKILTRTEEESKLGSQISAIVLFAAIGVAAFLIIRKVRKGRKTDDKAQEEISYPG